MPKQEQTITVNGLDKESILAVCYTSFKQLNWVTRFAGEERLLGATPKKWNANSQPVIATAADNTLTVSSETTAGELMDVMGKNKKNVTAFLTAFELAKTSMQPADYEENKKVLTALREETDRVVAAEKVQAAEIDKAMNLSGSNLYATYTIIAINIMVFILMAIDGAGIMEPNGLVHLKWGSNFAPLTLSGDWWRLITNIFIHFGIIHLAMNMYCFYIAGVYLERLLGKPRYITAYLCTGVLASLTSLWWHKTPVNSAGASGAIFGMYGLFLAFLTTSLIPGKVRKSLFQSIGIFIVYNLAFGMKDGVDNSAHVGGLLSGFIIGYIYIAGIKKEKQELPVKWMLPLVIAATTGIAFYYLQHHRSSAETRQEVLTEIKSAGYKDNTKFDDAYNRFIVMQDTALSVLKDTTITDEVRNKQLKEKSLPAWDKAATLAKEMQSFDVSDQAHKKAGNVLLYIQLRKQEIEVIDEIITHKAGISQLNEVRTKINAVVETLK
jgi:rhomboid protease GluP